MVKDNPVTSAPVHVPSAMAASSRLMKPVNTLGASVGSPLLGPSATKELQVGVQAGHRGRQVESRCRDRIHSRGDLQGERAGDHEIADGSGLHVVVLQRICAGTSARRARMRPISAATLKLPF